LTEQTAMAVRDVDSLWEIGTMWAEPFCVRCVSFGEDGVFVRAFDKGLKVEKRREVVFDG